MKQIAICFMTALSNGGHHIISMFRFQDLRACAPLGGSIGASRRGSGSGWPRDRSRGTSEASAGTAKSLQLALFRFMR